MDFLKLLMMSQKSLLDNYSLQWFKNCLSNRLQCVQLNDCKSDTVIERCGALLHGNDIG